MENQVIKQLKERKSVRVFEKKDIPEEVTRQILLSALEAPSAGCQLLYSIIRIEDQEKKERLSHLCDEQPFIAQAPLVLVFCADVQKWDDLYASVGLESRPQGMGDLLLAVGDTMIAAQNAVTAAHSLGLGSCYIGDIMENCEKVRELLSLPKYVFPAGMLVIGYPTEQQLNREKPRRFELSDIVMTDSYERKNKDELRKMFDFKKGQRTFEEWVTAFCKRKYDSDFSKEMTRSVNEYLKEYKADY